MALQTIIDLSRYVDSNTIVNKIIPIKTYKYENLPFYLAQLDGADVELLPYSAKVLGSILTIGVVHMEFICFPCAHVDFLWVFQFPARLQRRAG